MNETVVEELKALADETRLRMISLLWEGGDMCSCEIERILDIRQSNASRHLHRLRQAGLVESYRKAQWIHYVIPEVHRSGGGYLHGLIETARSRGGPYRDDIAKLEDYRSRGFTCATIHEWVPFAAPAGAGTRDEEVET